MFVLNIGHQFYYHKILKLCVIINPHETVQELHTFCIYLLVANIQWIIGANGGTYQQYTFIFCMKQFLCVIDYKCGAIAEVWDCVGQIKWSQSLY